MTKQFTPSAPMGFNLLGLVLLWLLAGPTRAQTLTWQTAVAAAGDVQVQASTTDGTGNVYLAGGFAGTATFGSRTLSTTSGQEAFVAKWNAATGFAWAVKGTGTSTGRNLATAVSVANNFVYVTGNFVSPTLALGNTTLTNAQAGSSDIFFARPPAATSGPCGLVVPTMRTSTAGWRLAATTFTWPANFMGRASPWEPLPSPAQVTLAT